MKIKKAVIPAAGMGTRMLPATKSMPKEMLTLVDKPAIQYIVEEAVNSGIEDILIVLSRGKSCLEDHFDRSPELESKLLTSGKEAEYDRIRRISEMAHLQYVRQQEPKGLGDAVLCAKAFVGNEPFAVLYGDDVIIGEDPACRQLSEAYELYGKGVVGIKEVPSDQISRYSSLSVSNLQANHYAVNDMVEKPQTPEEAFSNFSILGRCVLPPSIFSILEKIPTGAGGELQLTDAMAELARSEGIIGVDYTGKRYDMGNKLGVLQAIVEVGCDHEDVGEDFKKYLKEFAQRLS